MTSTPSTTTPWPRNAVRSVLFVAARGTVGRTALGEFQRSLPPDLWGEFSLIDGWQRLKPFLTWCRVPVSGTQTIPLRELVRRLLPNRSESGNGDDRRLVEDVRYLVEQGQAHALLDQTIEIPRTEIGVKLGHRRSRETRTLYNEALRMCADRAERRRFAGRIDFDSAARELHRAIDIIHPTVLYESTSHRAVARALLKKRRSVRLRQERCGVIFPVPDPSKVHRLYVLSRLTLSALASALGIPRSFVRKSDHAKHGVELLPFPDVEPLLRRAAELGSTR